MGMRVSHVWACVCPLFKPWGLRTALQAWLYLLVILWNSGAAGFVTWFICRFHLGFSSDFRSLSLWSRQLNGLWIDLCRFLTDSMVPHYTLRLSIHYTQTVCAAVEASECRRTEAAVHLEWRQTVKGLCTEDCKVPLKVEQSGAWDGVSYSFVGRLRRLRLPGDLQIQCSPLKLWQHFLEKQKNPS